MRRVSLYDDHGGMAVMIALTMVVLLGGAAVAVDVGAMYAERRELQNGADAAALAVAQDCAAGDCGTYGATAQALADSNARDGSAEALVEFPTGNSVQVTTNTPAAADGTFLRHWFAPFLGIDSTRVVAQATAAWGGIGGAATLPVTISECEWDTATGYDPATGDRTLPTAEIVIYNHSGGGSSDTCHSNVSGLDMPGGFGWLELDGTGTCTANTQSGGWVGNTPGSGSPAPAASTGCTAAFFAGLLGRTVLVPIYSVSTGTGVGGQYHITGYAGFEITGYRVGGAEASSPAPCVNPFRCFSGRFVTYTADSGVPDPAAINYGATVIALTG
jgi:hypothetical protein